MTDFARLLAVLAGGGVEFIVIGGFAATAHGSAHVTADLDQEWSQLHARDRRGRHLKRAAGRPKDPERIAELEAIQEEKQGR